MLVGKGWVLNLIYCYYIFWGWYGGEKEEGESNRRSAHSEPPEGLSPFDRGMSHGWGPELRTVLIGWCVGVCEKKLLSRMPVLGHPLSREVQVLGFASRRTPHSM